MSHYPLNLRVEHEDKLLVLRIYSFFFIKATISYRGHIGRKTKSRVRYDRSSEGVKITLKLYSCNVQQSTYVRAVESVLLMKELVYISFTSLLLFSVFVEYCISVM